MWARQFSLILTQSLASLSRSMEPYEHSKPYTWFITILNQTLWNVNKSWNDTMPKGHDWHIELSMIETIEDLLYLLARVKSLA